MTDQPGNTRSQTCLRAPPQVRAAMYPREPSARRRFSIDVASDNTVLKREARGKVDDVAVIAGRSIARGDCYARPIEDKKFRGPMCSPHHRRADARQDAPVVVAR